MVIGEYVGLCGFDQRILVVTFDKIDECFALLNGDTIQWLGRGQ